MSAAVVPAIDWFFLHKVRTCSRYQFECHTTGECIAIYNACDGIIQCSDGSDEAPELGCPATSKTFHSESDSIRVLNQDQLFFISATEAMTTKTAVTTQPAINIKQSMVDTQQNSVIGQHPPLDWRGSRGRDRYPDRDQVTSIDLPSNADGNHWRTVQENPRTYAGKYFGSAKNTHVFQLCFHQILLD